MMRVFIIALSALQLYGATLLNQNIYERDERVDLMLSFDSVFEGKIAKANFGNAIVITLTNATAEKRYTNELNHPLVKKIEIIRAQDDNQLLINFYPSQSIDVIAAKTGDSYGLRLRVVQSVAPQKESKAVVTKDGPIQNTQNETPVLGFETKEELEISTSYILTVGALVIVAIVMMIIKRKVSSTKDSWLLPSNFGGGKKQKGVNVKFQKPIDSKNKIVLIEFEGREYLTLVGGSNVLLDSFENGKVVSEDGFEQVFEQNREKLNEYLKLEHSQEVSNADRFRQNAERV